MRQSNGCGPNRDGSPATESYPSVQEMLKHYNPGVNPMPDDSCATPDSDHSHAVDRSQCLYNEVVLDSRTYKEQLPRSIGAFFYMRNCKHSDAYINTNKGIMPMSELEVRQIYEHFRSTYGSLVDDVPLVAYDCQATKFVADVQDDPQGSCQGSPCSGSSGLLSATAAQ